MNVGTVWKMPAEVVTRAVNFSNDLAIGETLSSIVSVIAFDQNGNDVSASIIGPTSPLIQTPANTTVQIQMQNGTLGASYTITITVASTASNVYQATIVLFIGLSIDLTTLSAVKSWVQISQTSTSDDQIIQDCITAFSAYVLKVTGRGPTDGSIPASSPFVAPVSYDEFYDGSGTLRQPIRNWPVQSVSSVNVNGQPVPQSTSVNVWGFVVDQDKRFISIRGGYSATIATFQNYRYQYGRGLPGFNGPGFSNGVQNVEIVYMAGFNGVPFDLEMAARKTVALNYKRRSWIGQKSQAMAAGAGTLTYGTWEMDTQDMRTIDYYTLRVA